MNGASLWRLSRGLPALPLLLAVLSAVQSLALADNLAPEYRFLGFQAQYGSTVAHSRETSRTVGGASREIDTVFYSLRLTTYELEKPAGPLDPIEDPLHFSTLDNGSFLLITRLGNLFHLTLEPSGARDESLVVKKLTATFPINLGDFERFANKKKLGKWAKSQFRINDLHIDVEAGERVLYVSHQFFNAEKECLTSRISKLDGSVSDLLDDGLTTPPRWRTLYETLPCFPLQKTGHPLEVHQAGGRIIHLDGKYLLFTVGDHGFDGHQGEANYPQATEASYGKILRIDRKTGRGETFSLGHRNPQGIYRYPGGAIYATEHGPHGGDELNKIEEGKNYGWPHVIYGTDYNSKVWPVAGVNQNSHQGYELPVFAWTPSIGISNLVGVERDLFPLWRGNLLVASLGAKTVFRLQMHGDRVVYVESIRLKGSRIRDMAETPNGEIWLSTDTRHMLRLRPQRRKTPSAAVTAGKKLYALCAECHSVERNGPHGIGPNLHDVVGKRVARSAGYDYSPALRARSSERWTRENLLAFMEDPEAFAPGTKMQFRVADAAQRRALLRYLEAR